MPPRSLGMAPAPLLPRLATLPGAGGGLLDSFYVVPSQPGMLNHGRSVGSLSGSAGGSELGLPAGAAREAGGHASLQAPHTLRAAALAAENLRLTRENATLRQQGAEMHAALGKVQRRAAEQLTRTRARTLALTRTLARTRTRCSGVRRSSCASRRRL